MVLAGWYNAYCAEAKVYHSHNYTILQEVRRYFDTGAFHAMSHGSVAPLDRRKEKAFVSSWQNWCIS